MRDYLYLWHDPPTKRLIASGIEFRDIAPDVATTGGIVLLRHQCDHAQFDAKTRLEFAFADRIGQVAADDIYGYGDFCWADFGYDVALADLNDSSIAEMAFFSLSCRPLREVAIPGLGNRLLCYAHDDGWYARIFYDAWSALEPMLGRLLSALLDPAQAARTLKRIERGEAALWCSGGAVVKCDSTEDIDALQHRYLKAKA